MINLLRYAFVGIGIGFLLMFGAVAYNGLEAVPDQNGLTLSDPIAYWLLIIGGGLASIGALFAFMAAIALVIQLLRK